MQEAQVQETQVEVSSPAEALAAETAEAAAATTPVETEPKPEPPDHYARWEEIEADEAMKPVLARRDARVRTELETALSAELEGHKKSWETSQVRQQVAGYYGNIIQKLEAGDVDGADKLLDRLEQVTAPYEESYKESLRREGQVTGHQNEAGRMLINMRETLPTRKAQDEFQDLVEKPSTTWPAVFKAYAAFWEDRGVQKKADKAREAALEEVRAETLKGNRPDLADKTGGGTTIIKPEDLDKISTAAWVALPKERREQLLEEARRVSA